MEAVGLAVGVAGLAGLFSACIDCFELVQRGRYHGRDYLLLETKFTNQRLRLRTWGRACGLTNENAEDASDILGDHELRASVENTLAHLFALFRDGRALRTKYGLKEDQPSQGLLSSGSTKIGAMVSNRLSGGRLGHMLQELGDTVSRTQKEAKMTTKVRWAIEDKAKFSELVQHMKDLIDDLDGLTRLLAVPERQKNIIRCEITSISDIYTLETMEEARVGRLDVVSDAASVRLWDLQDRSIEDFAQRTPADSQNPSHASNITSEDEWHDVSLETWRPPDKITAVENSCYRTLHKVSCPYAETSLYLDAPRYNSRIENDHQWIVVDRERPTASSNALHLCGRRTVPDLEAFLAQSNQISFVVLNQYECRHDGSQREDQIPETSGQSIYLWSFDLRNALKAVLTGVLPLVQLEEIRIRSELQAPYLWCYRSREKLGIMEDNLSVTAPFRKDLKALVEVVSSTMVDEYAAVDALISQGLISWEFLPYIFTPGDVVLQTCDKGRDHHQAYELISVDIEEGADSGSSYLALELQSWVLYVTFEKAKSSYRFTRSQFVRPGHEGLAIATLPIYPLAYADKNMRAFLAGRGQLLLDCRYKRMVNYSGWLAGSAKPVTDRRIMIDTSLYYQLHPERSRDSSTREQRRAVNDMLSEPVDEMFLLLLPPNVYGYDMQEHQWKQLLVSGISPVWWKKELFDQLILPVNDKELLQAMATSSLTHTDSKNDNGKGLGRYLLIHGPPGTGKTFAAEAVAELIERPLFQISFSNMGSSSKTAQEYLQKIAFLCNRWECIVLLAGADVFFEKRSYESLERNAMVLAIVEALDSFTGMIILTSDRASVLDNSIQSRCQLAIGLHPLSRPARRRIWINMLQGLEAGSQGPEFELSVDCFAGWELNGLQIKNVIRMATQMAHAKGEELSERHIHLAGGNLQRLMGYFTRVESGNRIRREVIPNVGERIETTSKIAQAGAGKTEQYSSDQ